MAKEIEMDQTSSIFLDGVDGEEGLSIFLAYLENLDLIREIGKDPTLLQLMTDLNNLSLTRKVKGDDQNSPIFPADVNNGDPTLWSSPADLADLRINIDTWRKTIKETKRLYDKLCSLLPEVSGLGNGKFGPYVKEKIDKRKQAIKLILKDRKAQIATLKDDFSLPSKSSKQPTSLEDKIMQYLNIDGSKQRARRPVVFTPPKPVRHAFVKAPHEKSQNPVLTLKRDKKHLDAACNRFPEFAEGSVTQSEVDEGKRLRRLMSVLEGRTNRDVCGYPEGEENNFLLSCEALYTRKTQERAKEDPNKMLKQPNLYNRELANISRIQYAIDRNYGDLKNSLDKIEREKSELASMVKELEEIKNAQPTRKPEINAFKLFSERIFPPVQRLVERTSSNKGNSGISH